MCVVLRAPSSRWPDGYGRPATVARCGWPRAGRVTLWAGAAAEETRNGLTRRAETSHARQRGPPDATRRGRRDNRSMPAVGDEVERFEHELPDHDLAPAQSHDGLTARREVPDLDHYVRHRPLLSPLVCVDLCIRCRRSPESAFFSTPSADPTRCVVLLEEEDDGCGRCAKPRLRGFANCCGRGSLRPQQWRRPQPPGWRAATRLGSVGSGLDVG